MFYRQDAFILSVTLINKIVFLKNLEKKYQNHSFINLKFSSTIVIIVRKNYVTYNI